MRKHHYLIAITILLVAQVCALPENSHVLVASQQSNASNIREDRSGKRVNAEAPVQCVTMAREFITYIFRKQSDIAKDNEAQNRWLSENLRKGLAHRQEVYREYVKRVPDTSEGPPDNSDFIGSWDFPTSFAVVGSRRYGERAIVDIVFTWGEKTNYPGDTRLVSYVFIHEGRAWKLDDIYTFRGKFTAGAHSLSEIFWKNDYP